MSPQKPHGASLPPRGPSRTGGTRVYPPPRGGGRCGASSIPLRGVPIPPQPRHNRRDSGASAAVWGWMVWCLLKTPTGRRRGPSKTGGNRVYPPLCEGGWCSVSSIPLRGVPIPPRPRQDRRDSGVSAAVWGWMVWCLLKSPTGSPYPPVTQAEPEGIGCMHRCVGVDGVGSPQNPHGASLSPRGPGRTGGTQLYSCGVGRCGAS